ncbi:MAG: FAD-dependent oxidoreductase [Betaproteobacteria bacterium]|nr:MAG: FAD-dependent oxidoreductase [Betaproteobacteria bacterium]
MRKRHNVEADVAIIGGGTAGLNSAMAAAEAGCSVLVVDKANIVRSGAIAGGIDHFFAYMDTGEPWDTREAYLGWAGRVARGAADLEVQEAVYCDELKAALERVERIGVSLRQPDGKVFRTAALGQPGPYAINFDGKLLKPKMAMEVKRRKCKVVNRVQVTKLYLHDGHFAGLTGFNIRNGDFYRIRAKAIVIATGNTNRMFNAQVGNPFNLWYCPANTGDLHRAAFDAGVALANMEYVRMTIVPKGFSAPGFNAFFGMGAQLVNSLGEPFVQNYHEMGNKAPRNWVVWGALQELKAGRGPIYMDCRHLKAKELEHLFFTLGIDKDTLPEFFRARGYAKDGAMIEMTVSEPMQARPSELCGSGIRIDKTCASNVPGIFAAGDASDQMGCLHMATAGGFAAGKHAAAYAKKRVSLLPLDSKAAEEEEDRVFRPLGRKAGISYREFETIVRAVCTDHFGPVKTEVSLKAALDKLGRLDAARGDLRADNMHELMRTHEAMNIHAVSKISATAALERRESRFIPYHYRADYPQTDDANYCGLVVIQEQPDGGITTRLDKLRYAA